MKEKKYKNRLDGLIKKFINRETTAYLIAGILTTVVNFVSYEGFYRLGISNLKANAIAWFIAVIFAYVVNKRNVFQSKSRSLMEEITKISKFFGARLVSLGIEQLGIYVFIYQLGIYRWLVKAGLAIFVILINYVFSKLYIFNKNEID